MELVELDLVTCIGRRDWLIQCALMQQLMSLCRLYLCLFYFDFHKYYRVNDKGTFTRDGNNLIFDTSKIFKELLIIIVVV